MSFLSGLFNRTSSVRFDGFTDWHCHILPGVDDGVRAMEDSVRILHAYEEAGINEVWLTPHIMEDVPNQPEMLRRRFAELQNEYDGNVVLHLASENMIDNLFLKRLDDNDLLPIGNDGKTLLVETSYFSAPMKFHETIDAIKAKGYFPLLAHPERYNYIGTFSEYKKLKEQGVMFQLNAMSLDGYYGPTVRDKAHRLLSEGMYDRIGTDLHREEHLLILKNMKVSNSLSKTINNLNCGMLVG